MGRSNIVGLPVALLLLKADATVTVVHSHTQDPESIIRDADIVIAAAGQAMMVTRNIYMVFIYSKTYSCSTWFLTYYYFTLSLSWILGFDAVVCLLLKSVVCLYLECASGHGLSYIYNIVQSLC